jgi:RNA polymerase sigma-70 factor (ECF subfamily)
MDVRMREEPQRTDQELIRAARRGDRRAYGELVLRYRERVVAVVYRTCGDPHLAEDAAQEAFLRGWQKLSSYRVGTSFPSWLYRIAVNASRDVLRRRQPTADVANVPLTDPQVGPEAALVQKERGERVREAVLALPPASRVTLVLREYEGLSYREIAEVLDVPTGTVMSRLHYARTRLREMLEPWMEEA